MGEAGGRQVTKPFVDRLQSLDVLGERKVTFWSRLVKMPTAFPLPKPP